MSDNATSIISKCRALGLNLWVEGDRIGISPTEKIPPGLTEQIREVKPMLLELLRGEKQPGIDITESIRGFQPQHDLPTTADIMRRWPSGRPVRAACGGSVTAWLHVAKQILSGEFDGCSKSMRESLTIGLRSIGHPAARTALAKLK